MIYISGNFLWSLSNSHLLGTFSAGPAMDNILKTRWRDLESARSNVPAAVPRCCLNAKLGWSYWLKTRSTERRLMAVSNSGMLKAVPVSLFGLRLDNDSVHIAVSLIISSIQPFMSCGEQVDGCGIHGLGCRTSSGSSALHFLLNIICRALASAGNTSVREPFGLGSYVDESRVEKNLGPAQHLFIGAPVNASLGTVGDTLAFHTLHSQFIVQEL